jgi:hypothetical protein
MEVTKPESTVIYFLCDNKTASRNSAVNVLRGLMTQLIQRHPHLVSILYSVWKIQQDNLFRANSFETLWRIFVQMLEALKNHEVCCVLDALDECDEESLCMLLHKIKMLFDPSKETLSKVSLKLLIASREEPKILPQSLAAFPRITLTDLDDDIHLYILEKVSYLAQVKHIDGDPLHHQIKEAFRKGAEGTFLWVSYMAKDLERKSRREIELALTELPRGLNEIYERIMTQIKVEERDKVAEMLMWILFAEHPLNILELCDAIQIQATETLTREEACFDYILSCGHLLQLQIIDEERGNWVAFSPFTTRTCALSELRTTFLHQSAKDFLLRIDPKQSKVQVINNSNKAHEIVLDRLIGLLEEHLCNGNDRIRELCVGIPLLNYSIHFWSFHMRQLHSNTAMIQQKHEVFFAKTSKIRDVWAGMYKYEYHKPVIGLPLLHMACAEGLYYLERTWLQPGNVFSRLRNQRRINQRWGEWSETPLHTLQ